MSATSERKLSRVGKLLLDSMATDQPSPEGRRRAALALGLAPIVPPSPPAAPAPTPPLAGHLYVRWAVGAVATAVLVGGVYLRARLPSPTSAPRKLTEQAALLAPPRATAPVLPPPPQPSALSPATAPMPSAPKRVRRAPAAQVAPSEVPAQPQLEAAAPAKPEADQLSSLSIETTLLDAARGALRQRASRTALDLLHRYDQEVPVGVLRAEADALRIEATQQSGDRAEAERLAERFFGSHRDSALTARVRALLEKAR